jgi:type IV pilus modification protein PilV
MLRRVMSTIAGFTLLEVLIAVVILAIGLLGLSALQIVAVRGNSMSGEMMSASMLAQQKLEELRQLDYDDADLAVGGGHSETSTDNTGVTYTLSWTVSEHASLLMKTVVLDVSWQSMRVGTAAEASNVTSRFTTCISQ